MTYKSVNSPEALLMWNGKLAKVTGISIGKTIHMEYVIPEDGERREISILEDSPLFQSSATAIPTLDEK